MEKFDRLQAVLWDMDGVLIDSRAAHYNAFLEAFEKYGVDVKSEEYHDVFGMPNDQIIQLMTGGSLAPELVAEIDREKDVCFRDIFASQAKLTEGVQEWLGEFKNNGIRQAVASSGSRENIRSVLEALQIQSYFSAIASGDECPGKPDPAVFLAAARKLNVEAHHCLVIEDSLVGVQAASAAGIRCVAITTSYPRELLSGASMVIEEFSESNLKLIQNEFNF